MRMNEIYKFCTFLVLVLVFSCIFPNIVSVGFTTVFIVFVYYFAWDYYAENCTVADGFANLLFKVRNLKSNDFYWNEGTSCINNTEMQNSTGNSFLFSPKSSLFAGNSRDPDVSRNIEPVTSTPMTYWMKKEKRFFTPPKQSLSLYQSRYSLSDTQNSVDSSKNLNQTINGPLLASTSFHNNVSTYLDSKSPGLTQRLLQYNKEYKPTHQPKYGRPGVLPIVHLNKKDKSERCIQPKQVKVRLSKPDYPIFTTPEHHKLLLDGLVQDPVRPEVSDNDSGTRSVLDALKEISRKRILANESPDDQDASKKQKMESLGNFKDQKRCREETSPQGVNGVDGPTKKRPCFVDALTASYLSTNLAATLKNTQKRKAQEIGEQMQPKDKKVLKSSDAETQTQTVATKEVAVVKEKAKVDDSTPKKVDACTQSDHELTLNGEEKMEEEVNEKRDEVVHYKIFDDAPLEITRKNKLRTLLGVMTGQKPELIPYENKLQKFIQESEKLETTNAESKATDEKQPVSIMSPQNKAKHDKHVTFNLPNEIPETEQPAKSTTETPSTSIAFTPSFSQPPLFETPKSPPSFGFLDNKVTTSPAASITSVAPVSVQSPPTFNFTSTPTIPKETKPTSPPKLGGFKFDLTTTPTSSKETTLSFNKTATVSSTPSASVAPTFLIATTSAAFGSSFTIVSTSSTAPISSPSFSFSSTGNKNSTLPSFPALTTSVATTTTSSFSQPISTTFNFTPAKPLEQPKSESSFSFGSNVSKPTVVASSVATEVKASVPSTSAIPTLFATTTQNVSSQPPATASVLSFSTNQSSIFGKPSEGFGVAATTTTASATTSGNTFVFGGSNKPVFGTTAATNVATTTASMFGNGSSFMTANGFGETPTVTTSGAQKNLFGGVSTNTTSGFGAVTTISSGFAVTTTAKSTTDFTFNAATTTSGFGFGGFGSNTAISTTTTPATTATSQPTFGGGFGATTAMSFGFGAVTTATTASTPSFGLTTTTATTTASNVMTFGGGLNFGANKTTASGFNFTTNAFGSTSTASLSFGTNTSASAPSFGAPVKSTPIFSFGSTNAENKTGLDLSAATSTFGSQQQTTAFGSSDTTTNFAQKMDNPQPFGASPFGTNTAFGSNTTFGSNNNNNSTFGGEFKPATTEASGFGKPLGFATPVFNATPASTFGTPNANESGGSFTSNAQPSSTFAFGQTQQNKVFSFGATEAPKTSAFNFSAGSNGNNNNSAPINFGSGGSSAGGFGGGFGAPGGFGSAANGSGGFGTSGAVPSFGGGFNPPTAGTFSIGSGGPTKTRTQLKARRRT